MIAALLSFVLFTPVGGCFSQDDQASKDCCGCMGDHGEYYCSDGKCIDGSKSDPSSEEPGSFSPSPDPSPPSSSDDSDAKPPRPINNNNNNSDGDDAGADVTCTTSENCSPTQLCIDNTCQ